MVAMFGTIQTTMQPKHHITKGDPWSFSVCALATIYMSTRHNLCRPDQFRCIEWDAMTRHYWFHCLSQIFAVLRWAYFIHHMKQLGFCCDSLPFFDALGTDNFSARWKSPVPCRISFWKFSQDRIEQQSSSP